MDDTLELGISSVRLNTPEFGLVPKEHVPLIWSLIEPILQEKGAKWLETVSEQEVYSILVQGNADLWCAVENQVMDGFVLAQWERHERASYYIIHYLAGRQLMKYMPKALQQLEHYACIYGAREIVMEVRPGIARLLRRAGYGSQTVRLKKNVRVLWSN